MSVLRFIIGLSWAFAACAPAVRHRTSSGAPAAASPSPAPISRASNAPPHCDPSRPAIEGFTEDLRPLVAARSNAAPVEPRQWVDGTLRFEIPRAWFPSRRHERNEVLYRVLTGDADDVVAIHRGPSPPIRLSASNGFRVMRGGVAIRGAIETDATGARRIEAIAVLPCEANPYVSMWARVRSTEHVDAVLDMIRSIATGPDEASPLREVTLDATRDRDAALALAGRDAVARELIERSLPNGLHARYPLTETHPLADQLLGGRFTTPIGAAPAEVLVSVPVQHGQAGAPSVYRALHDPSLVHEVADLLAGGCETSALQLSYGAIALRCRNGRDFRLVDDRDTAGTWPEDVHSIARFAALLDQWRGHADQVGGWSLAMCGTEGFVLERVDDGLVARTDRCALAVDTAHGAITSASFSGSCADVPHDAAGDLLRNAIRLDEIRGTGAGACAFTLGWNGRSSYALAAGDGGTASAPISSGPSLAVDRHAVHTAVAFVVDLERYVTGRSTEPPSNVLPSVLASLGAASPGDTRARELARRLAATAASGPGLAVLSARALDAQRVAVRFLAIETEVTESQQGWVITTARIPASASSSSPAGRPR